MGEDILSTGVAIVTAIIGLAIIAVVLSRQSQTASVIQTAGGALQSIIGQAVQPVSG